MNASIFRFAVLGGGPVVSELYLPGILRLRNCAITTVVDPDPMAADRLTQAGFRGTHLAMSFDKVWDKLEAASEGRPDAVVVALPNSLHEEATVQAVRRGYPVLVEKPLALTEAACLRIADVADQANSLVAVGMVRRLLPSVSAARAALAHQLLGDVTEIDVEDGAYYPWLSDSGSFFRPENGGILADMGVHYLDLVADLFGSLEPIRYNDDWCGGVEANAEYHLRTEAGIPVRVVLSRDRTLANRVRISGQKGTLQLRKDDFARASWHPASAVGFGGELHTEKPFTNPTWPWDFTSCFAQQFHEFSQTVRDGRLPRCGPREAAAIIRLVEWAYSRRNPTQRHIFGHRPADTEGPNVHSGRYLVTGGTGFIGSRLVARLADRDKVAIRAPVRSYTRCVELARFGVEMPRLNLLDANAVREAVRGSRYVFHLAYGRDGSDTREITITGTRNVVNAAIDEGCEVVVVLSTMYVFGRPLGVGVVDETFPYAPIGGGYGTTKAEMERWCLTRSKSSGGTRVVILNPSCVWGVQGKTYTRLPGELAANGQFCWVEDGRGIANHTYVENLVDALLLAAIVPAAHGRRYIINDTCLSWREFLTPLLGEYAERIASLTVTDLRAAGAPRRASTRDLVRAAARSTDVRSAIRDHRVLGWFTRRMLGWKRVKSRLESEIRSPEPIVPPPAAPDWLADLFSPDQVSFSAAAANRDLGWTPRVPFARGMEETVGWLRAVGVLSGG